MISLIRKRISDLLSGRGSVFPLRRILPEWLLARSLIELTGSLWKHPLFAVILLIEVTTTVEANLEMAPSLE